MKSSLFREITDCELRSLVSKSLHTELVSAHLLTGGLFNTTYFVETEKHGKTVLRVGPINRHLLMPFEHHLMEAEELVYSLCAAHGVPASEIIAADTEKDTQKWNGMPVSDKRQPLGRRLLPTPAERQTKEIQRLRRNKGAMRNQTRRDD